MLPPLVTIVLPVFNAGSLLELSVRSLLNQACQDWELLIIDDGSTDESVTRLTCLADPRIIVLQDGLNKGLSFRLNQGVSMARGYYFARMDHDDVCHPARLARQVEFLDAHPEVDLLATKCVTIDESDQLIGSLPLAVQHSSICAHPWKGFLMPHPTWMGRTEWFRRHPYAVPAPYCCEDQELLLRTYSTSSFRVLPEALLAYRKRRHTSLRKLWRTRLSFCAEQVKYFSRDHDYLLIIKSIFATVGRLSLDFLRELNYQIKLPALNPLGCMLPADECSSWNTLIFNLKSPT